jgi:hypothetical protein
LWNFCTGFFQGRFRNPEIVTNEIERNVAVYDRVIHLCVAPLKTEKGTFLFLRVTLNAKGNMVHLHVSC